MYAKFDDAVSTDYFLFVVFARLVFWSKYIEIYLSTPYHAAIFHIFPVCHDSFPSD